MTTPLPSRLRESAKALRGLSPCSEHSYEVLDVVAWNIAAELTEAADAMEAEKASKDSAYAERNQVVAALARLFPSGTARTAIEGWSDDWHGCVYIDLPTGQVSWHFHDSQAHLFADLPPYQGKWDGHDTPEKYRRLVALYTAPAAQVAQEGGGVEGKSHG